MGGGCSGVKWAVGCKGVHRAVEGSGVQWGVGCSDFNFVLVGCIGRWTKSDAVCVEVHWGAKLVGCGGRWGAVW